jgi:acetylornithine deacetylase
MDTAWKGDEEGIAEMGPGYSTPSYVNGEWIYGAGAYNMKSGLTTAIAAVEAVARSGERFAGDLVIAAVVGETCHAPVGRYQGARYRGCGYGGNYLVSHGVTADLAVIAEPTSSRVAYASGGYVYFELQVLGNPGASYVRGGDVAVKKAVDALEKALDLKSRIAGWAAGYRARNPYRGNEAANVTIVALESGHPWRPTKNPPFARLYIEVDTMPGQHPADVVAEFEALIDSARREDPDLTVKCSVVQLAHGAEVPADSFVVTSTAAAHTAVYGSAPEITYEGWFADTASFTRYGIPAICYGPGGRSAEGGSGYYPRSGEHASIEDLFLGAKVFVQLAVDVCNQYRATFVENHRSRAGSIVF